MSSMFPPGRIVCLTEETLETLYLLGEQEWNDPLISGIGWVSELVEIAGGIDIFGDRAGRSTAKHRIVTIDEVVAREPDLIIGSWCGKKFRPERVAARPSFASVRRPLRNQIIADLAARSGCID